MKRSIMGLASLFILLGSIFFLHAGADGKQDAAKQKGDKQPDPTFEGKKERVTILYRHAVDAEMLGEYEKAIRHYNEIHELFPRAPLPFYYRGRCLQRLGKVKEAIKDFSEFLKSDSDNETLTLDAKSRVDQLQPPKREKESATDKDPKRTKILADEKRTEEILRLKNLALDSEGDSATEARKKLDAMLLPKLGSAQKRHFDEALDNLNAALDLAEKDMDNTLAVRRAIEILMKLRQDVPDFLPAHAKLGLAFEQAKDFSKAHQAFDSYLKGYDKLGYAPDDRSDIGKRLIICATVAKAIAKKQEAAEAEAARATLTQKTAEVSTKKPPYEFIEKIDGGSGPARLTTEYSLLFDGDVMIKTRTERTERVRPTKSWTAKTVVMTERVNLADLDLNTIHLFQFDNNPWALSVTAAEKRCLIDWVLEVTPHTPDLVKTFGAGKKIAAVDNSIGLVFDDQSAAEMIKSLRHLIRVAQLKKGKSVPEFDTIEVESARKAIEAIGGTLDKEVWREDFVYSVTLPITFTNKDLGKIPNIPFAFNLSLLATKVKVSDVDLKEICRLKNLKMLFVSSSVSVSDSGLDELRRLDHLEVLHLVGATRITSRGAKSIAKLARLSELSIATSSISDEGLGEIAALNNLTSLSLAHTKVTDAGMIHLPKLRKLARLYLDGTSISDAGTTHIAKLEQLHLLDLPWTKVTDSGLSRLASLAAIDYVRVVGTQVTEAGCKELKAKRPNCKIINGSLPNVWMVLKQN